MICPGGGDGINWIGWIYNDEFDFLTSSWFVEGKERFRVDWHANGDVVCVYNEDKNSRMALNLRRFKPEQIHFDWICEDSLCSSMNIMSLQIKEGQDCLFDLRFIVAREFAIKFQYWYEERKKGEDIPLRELFVAE